MAVLRRYATQVPNPNPNPNPNPSSPCNVVLRRYMVSCGGREEQAGYSPLATPR